MRTATLYMVTVLVACGAVLTWLFKDFILSHPNSVLYFLSMVVVLSVMLPIIYKHRHPESKNGSSRRRQSSDWENRRRFDRIRHRLRLRPVFEIDGTAHEVHDLSEQGLCFTAQKDEPFKGWVHGTLVFDDAERIDLDGLIVRRTDTQVSLQLITTIPSAIIERERQFELPSPSERMAEDE